MYWRSFMKRTPYHKDMYSAEFFRANLKTLGPYEEKILNRCPSWLQPDGGSTSFTNDLFEIILLNQHRNCRRARETAKTTSQQMMKRSGFGWLMIKYSWLPLIGIFSATPDELINKLTDQQNAKWDLLRYRKPPVLMPTMLNWSGTEFFGLTRWNLLYSIPSTKAKHVLHCSINSKPIFDDTGKRYGGRI